MYNLNLADVLTKKFKISKKHFTFIKLHYVFVYVYYIQNDHK